MVARRVTQVLNRRRFQKIAGKGYKRAAVLVPIQERPHGDHLVLTQRADGLPTHRGQIAFPGGRVAAADADEIATALRESHEEIGLAPSAVQVLGVLDQRTAGYGYVVTPVVGLIPPRFKFRIDPRETTAVASVPIERLMEAGHFVADGPKESPHAGAEAVPLSPGYHFYVNGWDVWGVTARIIAQFLELAYDFHLKKS